MWWEVVAGTVGGLLILWSALVAALYWTGRKQQDPTRLKDVLRLVPDVIRLFRRLASDPTLPRGVRVRMALLTGYLLSPVDLVPDFIPVVGYADDALIVVWALRSVTRAAGADALDRHWPGSPEGLEALRLIAGVKP
jgi:uncharacterized membrane protein YkvA (DUF1232 family)